MKQLSIDNILNGFESRYIGIDKEYLIEKIKCNSEIPIQFVNDLLSVKAIDENQYYIHCKLVDIINCKIKVHNKLFN